MTKRKPARSSRLTPVVRAGLIAGVAAATVAFPLAAICGLGALAVAGYIESLPSQLTFPPPAQVSYLYAADGKTLITQFYEEYRRYTPYNQISPHVVQAIVSSEDQRFYDHHGVDLRGIVRAFVANQRAGAVSQGASTLTMQYVRNVQRDAAQSPQQVRDATEQTPVRKLKEMRLAVAVERQLTKEQILERYLNVAYFGHRAYGIYAAAEVYFSKRPNTLTLAEAATLAGLVKAPSAYDPATDKYAARQRRDYVIDRMVEMHYVTPAQAAVAQRQPIRLRLTNPPNDCISVNPAHNDWGFFCDIFKNWWRGQEAFGATPEQREENLRRGGYTIVSTLDPRLQRIARTQVTRHERVGSSYAHGVVAIEPGTGMIKAAAVNRRYSLDQRHNGPNTVHGAQVPSTYPNTVNPLLGGGDMPGYQAGSTFKIFTLLAALDLGVPLNARLMAPYQFRSIYLAGEGDPTSCGIHWCPHNASKSMTGVQTLWSGFGKSVNTFFVRLEEIVGAQRAVQMAERLGLTWHTPIDRLMAQPEHAGGWGAFTLGVADTTPLEMANAYATIAADGRYCEPWPVRSMVSAAGATVDATPNCHQALRPQVARAAVDAARCVTGYGAALGSCGGWSTASGVYGAVGRPVAGKTGTTDDTRAAWFIGITPTLAAASFIADPDNIFHVAGDRSSWKPTSTVAGLLRLGLAGTPVRYFTPPDRNTAYGNSFLGEQRDRPRRSRR
ncbi:MAG: transglycosylase domain-containing protein [Micromonosporaceae bacterium]